MLTYAAPDDLMDGWLDEEPESNVSIRAIRYASVLVRHATRLDCYDTEPSGAPVDLDIVEAMRDAVCAQAAEWIAADINPAAGTVGREVGIASESADGGSVTYTGGITAEEVKASLTHLCAMAMGILRDAGLCSARPQTW